MTGQNIIDECRSTMLDSTAPYRWSDALLLGWLNDGIAALFSRRPDCAILDTDETISIEKPVALVDLAEVPALEDRWRPALVHYVLWRVYDTETDAHEEGAKGRALGYKARFDDDAKVT